MAEKKGFAGLVSGVVDDAAFLVTGTAELAKTEIRAAAGKAIAALVFLALAITTVCISLTFFANAIVHGIAAAGLPLWASYLIVGGVVLLLGLVFLFIAGKTARKIRGPERTVKSVADTVKAFATIAEETRP